jgi:UDP-4-amino-4,6-dideoxy-N-acetyl-beta-L-altrosamine transaminase
MLRKLIQGATPNRSNVLPYGRHFIGDDDIESVARVLRGEFLTTGPAVPAFEEALAEATGSAHAVAVSSGAAALHLAARALGLGPGDTVIVPTNTFVATANAARHTGAEVIFADVDPDTGLMTTDQLKAAISELPPTGKRALFNVHFAGQCENLEAIARISREANLKIVDDACHAIGAEYRTSTGRWHKIGSCAHADLSIFSFHPVKTIAMGEGGAITLNDPALAARIRRDRTHGLEKDPALLESSFARDVDGEKAPWAYELINPGYNYRASDIHCALGTSQLNKLSLFVRERRALAAAYEELLDPLWPIVRPLQRLTSVMPAWHLGVALIDFPRTGLTRRALMATLRDRGVGSQVHYIPVHRQPYFESRYGAQDLPGAETYYNSCLTLPLFVGMTHDDVQFIVETLANVIGL